jgi:hypothetical protein
VPPPLANVPVRILDLGLLQAGAGIRGEFENRLRSVIDEVAASPQPLVLFIDEAAGYSRKIRASEELMRLRRMRPASDNRPRGAPYSSEWSDARTCPQNLDRG